MWELDYKESWVPNNWFFWTVVLEKTLESPLDCKKIEPVHPKGNQSISPEYSLEGLMLKLKLQYFGHLMWRTDSLEKTLILGRKAMTHLDRKQRHYFANKDSSSRGYGFSCGHVSMWELDCEEGWAPKNWCFWTVVLEKTLESPLDCKEIQPVHSEADQPWDFFGRNDAKAETPVLATSCKELSHWKRLWCWEGLGSGGEGDDRAWDGWMLSLTRWTWVWVDSGSWWWTGRPGVLWFMGSQRVGHNWATSLH